jgi:hypothetical protein
MTGAKILKLLASYPRERPLLTEAHRKVYVEEYKLNRSGEGLLYGLMERLEAWGHRQIATLSDLGAVLEIGAGSLNHLVYEPEVQVYDCVEPFAELFEGSPQRGCVRNLYAAIEQVPDENRYARIFSFAALEHLERLPQIVARAGLLLDADGVFQALIPSEGGFSWGASWRCTTGVAYRLRTGLPYGVLMRHEHVNDAVEVLEVIEHFFGDVRIRRFPLPWHHLSFYTYLEARGCDRQRCSDYLAEAG